MDHFKNRLYFFSGMKLEYTRRSIIIIVTNKFRMRKQVKNIKIPFPPGRCTGFHGLCIRDIGG